MERAHVIAAPQAEKLPLRMSDRLSSAPSTRVPKATREAAALEFGRFVDQTDGIVQSEQLFSLLADFALNFDWHWISYGTLSYEQESAMPAGQSPLAMMNFPDRCRKRYCVFQAIVSTDFTRS
ncbi:hypothetical protein RFM68_31885 [Mesorhizobium sp. MSK_1335]|uniref:Uncharacterized protein n=1 Tax=Mesorhizobium montanum TaxID=3072323 RepID=A0ABU4ZUH4_9HYPH|nr:hypothetical protein [Mesorhizobium sp. MSK_1335]MDX8529065.1 hypothetical protein [Mesorhizobium sp. MSK_1335]